MQPHLVSCQKAIDHGKEYLPKPLLPSPKFDREIEQVREIHEKYTSDQRLLQMRHPFNTQMNESFNMRVAEFAPKSKSFSRSASLQHRINHAIAIHNLGYRASYSEIFASLKIPNCSVFDEWKKQKERKKKNKRAYDSQIKNKRKRAYKTEEKKKELLYLERSMTPKDGNYKCDKGEKKEKESGGHAPKRKRKRNPCSCGQGRVHYSSKYEKCARNSENRNDTNDTSTYESEPNNVTCTSATDK